MQKLVLFLLLALVTHNALASYDIKLTDEMFYSTYYSFVDEAKTAVAIANATQNGNPSQAVETYTGSFEIPESIVYNDVEYPVTAIAEGAFYYCTKLTEVIIPNTITSIGDKAFYMCTGIQSIDIPETVSEIDAFAFNNCTALTKITIPEGVTEIAEKCFLACSSLTTVELPSTIESIAEMAFNSCSKLTTVNIEATEVPNLGNMAFNGCKPANATVNVPDEAAWNYYKSDWTTYFTIGNNLSFTDGTYTYSVTSQSDKTVEVSGFSGEYIIIDNIIDEVAYDDELTFTITSVADGLFSNVVLWVPAVDDYAQVAELFKDVKKNPDIYYEGVYYNIVESTLKATTIQLEVTSGPEAYTGDLIITDGFYYDGNYYQVIGIEYDAFSNTSNLASVILDTTVPIENADALLQIPDGCTIIITNRDTYEELASADPGNKNIVFKDETVDNNTQTATDTEEHEKGDTTGTDNTVNVGGGLGSTRTEFPSEKSTDADEVTPEGVVSAIANINIDRVEVARYTLSGARISEPQKGINIVKYSDGTTVKVLVK